MWLSWYPLESIFLKYRKTNAVTLWDNANENSRFQPRNISLLLMLQFLSSFRFISNHIFIHLESYLYIAFIFLHIAICFIVDFEIFQLYLSRYLLSYHIQVYLLMSVGIAIISLFSQCSFKRPLIQLLCEKWSNLVEVILIDLH